MGLSCLTHLAGTMPCWLGSACLCGHSGSGLCASYHVQISRAHPGTRGDVLCVRFEEGREGKWEQSQERGSGYWDEGEKDQRQNWGFKKHIIQNSSLTDSIWVWFLLLDEHKEKNFFFNSNGSKTKKALKVARNTEKLSLDVDSKPSNSFSSKLRPLSLNNLWKAFTCVI